ncbi:MAG: hypothetical protein RLZZ225_469, partial [Pseudomonadota bacterium]
MVFFKINLISHFQQKMSISLV